MCGEQHPTATPWRACCESRDQPAGRDVRRDETDPSQSHPPPALSGCLATECIAVKFSPSLGMDTFEFGGRKPSTPILGRCQYVE